VGKTPEPSIWDPICLRSVAITVAAVAVMISGCTRPRYGPETFALNQEVHVGVFAFTVTKVDLGVVQLGNKTAKGAFVVVDLSVRNIGDAPRTVYCQNQKLEDLAGKTYDGVNVDAGADLLNITPGKQVQFSCAFDVPKGTQPGYVVVHDSPNFRSATVRLLDKG